jgi:probable phosphoglycerate mutase
MPGRAPGLHLAPQGISQAETAAERIGALARPPVAVYASPLERTMETAKPIARRLGVRVRTERGLLECDVGAWTGLSLRVLRRRREWRTLMSFPAAFRFPGGESLAEMQARVLTAIDGLAHRHPGETFVAVTHADPIRVAVAAIAGVPLDLFHRLVVSPCSVSALVLGDTAAHVLCVNATASLAELAPS